MLDVLALPGKSILGILGQAPPARGSALNGGFLIVPLRGAASRWTLAESMSLKSDCSGNQCVARIR